MPRKKRTKMTITDVGVEVTHTNDKGIKVEGRVIIAVKVQFGKYIWRKAYGFLEKDLKDFSIDEFKNRIYKESRIWIQQKNLENDVLDRLQNTKNETIYLD